MTRAVGAVTPFMPARRCKRGDDTRTEEIFNTYHRKVAHQSTELCEPSQDIQGPMIDLRLKNLLDIPVPR